MPSSPPPTSTISLSESPTSSSSSLPASKINDINNASALSRISALLRQILRITTTDGRIFIGTFAGTDKPLNIILVNTDEYRIDQQGDGRYVGQVMFPWKMITKVEAHTKKQLRTESYHDYDYDMYS